MGKRGIHRGDIFLSVDFTGVGSEQRGVRPCVVVSNEACNLFSKIVTVLPLTAKTKVSLPTHCTLDSVKYNLRDISTVLGEQITTLDKSRLGKRHRFKLDEEDMKKIDKLLYVQLSLY